MKTVKEINNFDLLELVCQSHAKAARYTRSKEMHDIYIEARLEMEGRLKESLEALQNLENDNNQIPEHAWKMVQDAINCALGKQNKQNRIMKNFKSVYIKIEKPNIRQRIIIITANFLLWLIVYLFKDDEDKMITEMKDVIINAYKAL